MRRLSRLTRMVREAFYGDTGWWHLLSAHYAYGVPLQLVRYHQIAQAMLQQHQHATSQPLPTYDDLDLEQLSFLSGTLYADRPRQSWHDVAPITRRQHAASRHYIPDVRDMIRRSRHRRG